ncbi:hypothetical protein DLNHIDIE_02629 [Acidithiobacillus thiooxidans ATCC 19377]|uniref:Uncharacterized protein n=1 Tax=Acidithiobacillus thiooxidans ATCC 19377 TaxID=637390 RepID=A0A543Q0N5_ACITH|nr:hypothetical protein DLNHIDIE_02629 [Acidithiobacillus thiooxidans ATCC 19377]
MAVDRVLVVLAAVPCLLVLVLETGAAEGAMAVANATELALDDLPPVAGLALLLADAAAAVLPEFFDRSPSLPVLMGNCAIHHHTRALSSRMIKNNNHGQRLGPRSSAECSASCSSSNSGSGSLGLRGGGAGRCSPEGGRLVWFL